MPFVQYLESAKEELESLGCDKQGLHILHAKEKIFSFLIKDLKTPAAHILKQESLAVGADFALPKDAILYQKPSYCGILMLTRSQSKPLLRKLSAQPFGLKEIAKDLQKHMHTHFFPSQIMGIVNLTPDSFYADSRKCGKEAELRIIEMIEEGVHIIDIGAISTRPGSDSISETEEMRRLSGILDFIQAENIAKRVALSIDTTTPKVAHHCLELGFSIVNDITGFHNPLMLQAISGYDCTCVAMHMQGNPKEMQQNPQYQNLFLEIEDFFAKSIESLQHHGINNIILDVGIGFGKTLEHNCALIKNIGHFLHFGCPLLIGASRKSMIDKIFPCSVDERLAGTLAIHLEALRNGASIIRCHDTKEHLQALSVQNAITQTSLLKDRTC